MTTLREAAKQALEALEHIQRCIGFATATIHQGSATWCQSEDAIASIKAALAQQGEQQPVCSGCGIPAGDVHMSTCKSGKWPSRVSNGDTAAPAPQPAQGEPVAWKVVTFNSKTTKSFLTKPEAMNYLMSNDADGDWYIEAVLAAAPAPAPQAQEPARNVTKEEDAILRGALLRSGTVIHPKPAPQPAQGVGRTNPGDETGGAVERFGWQTFLGKSPEIIPATNGSFVWYSDYLKLWQSAQPEDGCAPNHMCNGHRVHIPTGECCNKCGATSW